jgi:hypothetical protein
MTDAFREVVVRRLLVCSLATWFLYSLAGVAPASAQSDGEGVPEETAEQTDETEKRPPSAPETLEIGTDRPGAADGTGIVQPNHFQIETGFNADFHPDATQVNFADSLFRFGIHEYAEARLFTSPFGLTANTGTGSETQTLGNLTLGGKFATPVGDDAAVGILPYVSLDNAVDPGRSWSGGGTLLADIGTSQSVHLTFNLGVSAVERATGDYGAEVFGSLVGNVTLSDRIGSFVEVYAIAPPQSEVDTFIDGGVTYGLSDRFQLDGWLGLQIAATGSRMVGLGASYLL